MKNKDGIEILVGQVWEIPPVMFKVVGIRDNFVWLYCGQDKYETVRHTVPSLIDEMRLISCPVLGDMEGWDIVTEQQKRDYNKPVNQNIGIVPGNLQSFGVISIDAKKKGWYENNAPHWDYGEICRVPRGFDWEPYRKDKPTETVPARIEPIEVSDVAFDIVECAIKINEIINHLNMEQ